jgi:hypothetical protein
VGLILAALIHPRKGLTPGGENGQGSPTAMKPRSRRGSRDGRSATPPRLPPLYEGRRSDLSPTAIAAEALRTGLLPATSGRRREAIPRDEAMRVGDPDDSTLANEYVGEETPGGSSPTPDQNDVDDIGRAYGLQDEDNGALRSAAEVLQRRDRWRSELMPPRKPQP